jgi:hypothetical protein
LVDLFEIGIIDPNEEPVDNTKPIPAVKEKQILIIL